VCVIARVNSFLNLPILIKVSSKNPSSGSVFGLLLKRVHAFPLRVVRNKMTLSRLVEVIRPDANRVIFLIGISLLGGLVELAGAGSLYPFLRLIASPEYVHQNEYLSIAYAHFGFEDERIFIAGFGVLSLILVVSANAFVLWRHVQIVRFTTEKMVVISRRVLGGYVNKSIGDLSDKTCGEITKNVCELTDKFVNNVLFSVITIIADGILLFALAVMLLSVDSIITPVVAVLAGAVVYVALSATKRRLVKYGTESDKLNAWRFNQVINIVKGLKEIQVYKKQRYFIESFDGLVQKLGALHARLASLHVVGPMVLQTTFSAAVLLLAIVMIVHGLPFDKILPLLTMIGVIGVRVITPLNRLTASITNMRQHSGACLELLDLLEASAAPTDYLEASSSSGLFGVSCNLENISVTRRDAGAEVFAIRDLNLKLAQGQLIGIVGKSGNGKTTVAEIISGILKPDQGRVRIEATDSGGRREICPVISYVPSNVFLMSGSIRANIAFGVPEEKIDAVRMDSVVRLANLDDLVASLPRRLDADIGSDGSKLSAGQRQRIGIARGLYHDPKLLVLDEVTNSLDPMNEAKIIDTLKLLKGELLVVTIVHSRNFMLACDRIVMIQDGCIVEDGTPRDLMADSKQFQALLAMTAESL